MKSVHRTAFLGFALSITALVAPSNASAGIAERATSTKVAGINVVIYPMGVQDVVTLAGSLPAGDSLAAENGVNPAAATLVGMMLDKGTTKHDKFEIAKQLDGVGAQLTFEVGPQTIAIRGKSLKKDAGRLIELLGEELRSPAFAPEEFTKAKKQFEGTFRPQLEDTNFRARDAFLRAIFPQSHPNHPVPPQEWLAAVDRATLDDVKVFHRKYYGPAHLTLVFVGDVDAKTIKAQVAKAFAGWSGGVDVERSAQAKPLQGASAQTISLNDKASVSVVLGQPSGLRYRDPDRLPLNVGTAILGSGFTGRLMGTVRDKEGLTYGIGAVVFDDTFVDGDWAIFASFAPGLLEKGLTSTRRELNAWWQNGVTASELAERKTNLIGSFQVGLATTDGMAGGILQSIDRGKGIAWLDQLPKAIDALTVEQVNGAIKKHLDPKKMILVQAGTLQAK